MDEQCHLLPLRKIYVRFNRYLVFMCTHVGFVINKILIFVPINEIICNQATTLQPFNISQPRCKNNYYPSACKSRLVRRIDLDNYCTIQMPRP